MKAEEAWKLINQSKRLVALTGAGVSVVSGIPDYRSVKGIYQDIPDPEYLLSHSCLVNEPAVFYQFIKTLYHLEATPNKIHYALSSLTKGGGIITQNIDRLHRLAGAKQLIEFHGSLYQCYCMACGESVSTDAYLTSDRHQRCGGRLRPDVVLYEEGLAESDISGAIKLVSEADLLLVVGTSFKVAPFNQLINYKQSTGKIIVINDEPITLSFPHEYVKTKAEDFFDRFGADINVK